MWNGNGKFYVLEVNTIPGLTTNSLLPKAARAAGLSMETVCMQVVQMALERRSEAALT
jgi:D-alanine-D-alanine ligase